MTKKPKKWMQEAFGNHEGALKRQLHVPKSKTIPVMLLREVEAARIGTKVRNGNHWITVTRLLKHRVGPVLRAREARR